MKKTYDYYGASGVIDKIDKYLFDDELLLIGEDGANLLTRSKPIAFIATGKYWVNNHAHVIDATDKIILHWLRIFINAIDLSQFVTGSAQPKITQDNLNSIVIPLPPFAEQHRIVAAIESAFTVIDEIERNKTDLQDAITAAKSKILSLAIRGKLVPQDPNDEPASVLLERIRAEREQLIKSGKIKQSKSESTIIKGDDNSYNEKVSAGWACCRLCDVLDYEQPTTYIVENTDYNDRYQTPVLTAGKSFIIGYSSETEGICDNLPVIIFDDFTTDSRYVDFAFKVKSSAMKILRSPLADIKYLYYYMQTIECNHATHKRYWISDFSLKFIALPPLNEQKRITEVIEQMYFILDEIIESLS